MASIGTSLQGFISSIGGALSSGLGALTGAVERVAPLAGIGLETAAAIQALQSPGPRTMQAASVPAPTLPFSVRPVGALALPGGAPTMAQVSTSPFAMQAGLPAVVPSLRGLGQALVPGGSPGPVGCIAPMPTRGGLRLPRLVNVPNPTDPNKIETYVRAPRPRYRVSISGPRRRGGR